MSSDNEAIDSRVRFHFLSVIPPWKSGNAAGLPDLIPRRSSSTGNFPSEIPTALIRGAALRLHSSDGVSLGTGALLLFPSSRRRGDEGEGGGASGRVAVSLKPVM